MLADAHRRRPDDLHPHLLSAALSPRREDRSDPPARLGILHPAADAREIRRHLRQGPDHPAQHVQGQGRRPRARQFHRPCQMGGRRSRRPARQGHRNARIGQSSPLLFFKSPAPAKPVTPTACRSSPFEIRDSKFAVHMRLPSPRRFCLIRPCSTSKRSIAPPAFPASACTAATG